MKDFELPDIVKKINKDYGKVKITTLGRAKALRLKRMFSGSFWVDEMTGGGFAYKRIHLLFGARSAGKNAQLYQMMAYNQRLCRRCHGIRPDISTDHSADRWTVTLRDILGYPKCTCKDNLFESKRFVILDYEKTLSIESPQIITIRKIVHTPTEQIIDGLDYDEKTLTLSDLQSREKLSAKQVEWVNETESWLKEIKIDETQVEQLATPDYLKKCGVLTDELMVSDPEDTEEGVEYMREIIKSKEVDGIILDSLQAMVPAYVKKRESDEATMGAEPKANALMLRHVCSAFSAADLEDEADAYMPALFINSQVRSVMGTLSKKPASFSGGHAVAHHTSLALELKTEYFLREDGSKCPFDQTFYGQKVRLRTDKNKLAAPGDMHGYSYYFRDGSVFKTGEIDHTGEIVEICISKGSIEKAGAWYRVKGKKFNGLDKLKEFFMENPSFVGELYKDMKLK